jgi:hypothetical protein
LELAQIFISLPGTPIFTMMLKKVFRFYYDGFRSMTWGRKLWGIILIKLFIMFAILRIFFFPDILKKGFDNDEQRSLHVLEQITEP